MEIRKSGYPEIRISGYPEIRKSGFPEIRISGFPDIRKSGMSESLFFLPSGVMLASKMFRNGGTMSSPAQCLSCISFGCSKQYTRQNTRNLDFVEDCCCFPWKPRTTRTCSVSRPNRSRGLSAPPCSSENVNEKCAQK